MIERCVRVDIPRLFHPHVLSGCDAPFKSKLHSPQVMRLLELFHPIDLEFIEK